jgi:serine/threonine protein phosphatase PrpC
VRRCPACHALYPDDDRFCEVDGEVLVAERNKILSAIPTLPVAAPPADVKIVTHAKSLLAEGPEIAPEKIPDIVRETLALARSFERAGLAWQPQPEDFVKVENGALGSRLALASARGVFKRPSTDTDFDVRPALRALGEALLDAPVAMCTTAVVRLLSDPKLPRMTIDEAIARLEQNEELVPDRFGAHAATLAHIGYKRATQQDAACAYEESDERNPWTILILCDGVSASRDGALAANIGSAAAKKRAIELMRAAESLDHVVRDAILAGHRAVCDAVRGETKPRIDGRISSRPPGPLAADRSRETRDSTPPPNSTSPFAESVPPHQEPPGATIVVAAIRGANVAIGWAGDSRAYVASSEASELLTHDHSWANAMLATGHITEEEAFAQPMAYALTRCIGPLDDTASDLVPEVRVATLPNDAVLVLCSDGVWSYLARPDAMAAMVHCVDRDASLVARALVHEALLRGGHDNASVAVYVVK